METPVDSAHLKAALAAAQTMKADSVAAEVSAALRAEGIRCIVVKGPSTARLLYDPNELRPYADCDLLVSPSGFDLARPVLEGLGFTEHLEQADHPERGLPHAIPWTRNDGGHVDLHRNLSGTGIAPAAVWRVLIQRTEPLMLSGELVAVPDAAGVALQVALHAGQHDRGAAAAKPRADLTRAVQRLSPDVWREAVVLADSLAATGALTVGLRLDPEGSRLADSLGLPSPEFLDSSQHARIASGVGRLAATRGRRAQIQLAFGELFPSAEFMRWWSPLARRGGTAGLLAAYGERALWLLRQLGPSLALARRSRR